MAGIGCYTAVRIAGNADIREHIARNLGEKAQVDLDAFFDQYALLKSKGISDDTAQRLAQDVVSGREPASGMTRRFAGVQGLPFPSDSV
jgi:hypothetical protein